MQIKFDLENEKISNLKHIRFLIDEKIEENIAVNPNTTLELLNSLEILKEIENKIGKTIPELDFINQLMKKSKCSKKEAEKIVKDLKDNKEIFEIKQGWIRRGA